MRLPSSRSLVPWYRTSGAHGRGWLLACVLGLSCSEYGLNGDPDSNDQDDSTGFGQNRVDDDDSPGTPSTHSPPETETSTTTDGTTTLTALESGLTGRICDPAGTEWVVGATVWIDFDNDGDGVPDDERADLTSVEGRYLLKPLPAGPHTDQVEKGSFTTSFDVDLPPGEILEIPDPVCLDRDSVKIAVVTGVYDDIGAILDALTVPYDNYDGVSGTEYITFLSDPAMLAQYDIIFLNCGIEWGWLSSWGTIGTNLVNYVSAGGSLYASDWAYSFFEAAFPDHIDFYGDDATIGAAMVGDPGLYTGTLVDPNMQALLGSNEAELYFDLNMWVIPTSVDAATSTLVSGDPRIESSGEVLPDLPLAVSRNLGSGTFIFTSFHNEPQATLDMETILSEIILSL